MIVMLSGGKDSSALTYELVKAGENVLAVTVDNGFLSDIAKQNIERLVRILDVPHLFIRPPSSEYQEIIDKQLDLLSTCGLCSYKTMGVVMHYAKRLGIRDVYAGFSKYTALAQGWKLDPKIEVEDITIHYPYYVEYSIAKIRSICDELGLVFDPTQTNCKHLRTLIDRSGGEPFIREAQLLLKDNQITEQEFAYYREFCRPGGH